MLSRRQLQALVGPAGGVLFTFPLCLCRCPIYRHEDSPQFYGHIAFVSGSDYLPLIPDYNARTYNKGVADLASKSAIACDLKLIATWSEVFLSYSHWREHPQ